MPLRGISSPRTHRQIIIAHHLVFTGYGHWLPNDPRGSGSTELRDDKLEDLGPVHHGRKCIQPARKDLKDFYRSANPLLNREPIWFDSAKRQAIADAIARAIKEFTYNCYACAVLSNHFHLLIRRHRDDAQAMWDIFAHHTRQALLALPAIPRNHPVWSDRPYKVFCYTPDDIRDRITYIRSNPAKEKLPPQSFPFVIPYDGWPHPKPR